MFDNLLFQVKNEIRTTIKNAQNSRRLYTHESGRRLLLSEAMETGTLDGPVIGAIAIFYAKNRFMTVDRIMKKDEKFKKMRRIIYYLDSRAGQIGSTLLLELLKINDGEKFSKAKFVQFIDEEFFSEFTVSSGEINEALSRMLRKTMKEFFGINGKFFKRQNFTVVFKIIGKYDDESFDREAYEKTKPEIDNEIDNYIFKLNKTYT